MTIQNVAQAAAMFTRYGNVSEEHRLLATNPTEAQLREAVFQVRNNLRHALALMREYHRLPTPLGGDYA
jgi:arsenate reductase-like glutaredoxin family protein